MMQRLLQADALTILRKDAHQPIEASLRVPATLIFALAHQPEQAAEVLFRKIDYQIPPPPGGWTASLGAPFGPNAFKPHAGSTPNASEFEGNMKTVLDTMSRSDLYAERTPPLAAALVAALTAKIKENNSADKRFPLLPMLASTVKYTVDALDPLPVMLTRDQPLPPARPVDLQQFAPLATAIRSALALDSVAKATNVLLNDGLLPAMRTTRNPQLLDSVFELITATLDRYRATGANDKSFAFEADDAFRVLSAYRLYDLKPYAQRLREKYPSPAPPANHLP